VIPPIVVKAYEALQHRGKMKNMVQIEGSCSKREALQVRGRTEQGNTNYNIDNNKNDEGHSMSKREKKLCMYCNKENHFIKDYWRL
jgi:hypothetical protein